MCNTEAPDNEKRNATDSNNFVQKIKNKSGWSIQLLHPLSFYFTQDKYQPYANIPYLCFLI